MSYAKDLETRVANEVPVDLAKHAITTLKLDGMYRHWRCQESGTWNRGFDIVTWPGSLCFTGDMGEFLFQRTDNMVAFMRGSCMSFSYAAEKCVAHDGRLREWREEIFREVLAHELIDVQEQADEGDPEDLVALTKLKEKIEDIDSDYAVYQSEHDAMKAMYESGIWDSSDLPRCQCFTYHFLWALHAIKWFCDRVENA